MIVLGIDTANDHGSLAISYGSETLDEVSMYEPSGHSGALFEHLDNLLKRNRLALSDVDVYAAASGPGSFTGVRIGLTAAKALAEANGKPCFGVSNLAAISSLGSEPSRAAFLDARRGEVYGGVFGEAPLREGVAPFGAWLLSLPNEVAEFVTFDFAPFHAELDASRYAGAARTTAPRSLAAAVAEIALGRFRSGESSDPVSIDANYVRRSDAELLWKEAELL